MVIADEPTTALDVAVQSYVLRVLRETVTRRNIATILITHDIGVIARVSDTVSVLRSGRVVEQGPTRGVLGSPEHEYTHSLAASVPPLGRRLERFAVPGLCAAASGGAGSRRERIGAERASEWLLTRPSAHRTTGTRRGPLAASVLRRRTPAHRRGARAPEPPHDPSVR